MEPFQFYIKFVLYLILLNTANAFDVAKPDGTTILPDNVTSIASDNVSNNTDVTNTMSGRRMLEKITVPVQATNSNDSVDVKNASHTEKIVEGNTPKSSIDLNTHNKEYEWHASKIQETDKNENVFIKSKTNKVDQNLEIGEIKHEIYDHVAPNTYSDNENNYKYGVKKVTVISEMFQDTNDEPGYLSGTMMYQNNGDQKNGKADDVAVTSNLSDFLLQIDNNLNSNHISQSLCTKSDDTDNLMYEDLPIKHIVMLKSNENLQSFWSILRRTVKYDIDHHTEGTKFGFEKIFKLLGIFTKLDNAIELGASTSVMIDKIVNILESPLILKKSKSHVDISTHISNICDCSTNLISTAINMHPKKDNLVLEINDFIKDHKKEETVKHTMVVSNGPKGSLNIRELPITSPETVVKDTPYEEKWSNIQNHNINNLKDHSKDLNYVEDVTKKSNENFNDPGEVVTELPVIDGVVTIKDKLIPEKANFVTVTINNDETDSMINSSEELLPNYDSNKIMDVPYQKYFLSNEKPNLLDFFNVKNSMTPDEFSTLNKVPAKQVGVDVAIIDLSKPWNGEDILTTINVDNSPTTIKYLPQLADTSEYTPIENLNAPHHINVNPAKPRLLDYYNFAKPITNDGYQSVTNNIPNKPINVYSNVETTYSFNKGITIHNDVKNNNSENIYQNDLYSLLSHRGLAANQPLLSGAEYTPLEMGYDVSYYKNPYTLTSTPKVDYDNHVAPYSYIMEDPQKYTLPYNNWHPQNNLDMNEIGVIRDPFKEYLAGHIPYPIHKMKENENFPPYASSPYQSANEIAWPFESLINKYNYKPETVASIPIMDLPTYSLLHENIASPKSFLSEYDNTLVPVSLAQLLHPGDCLCKI